MKRILAILLLCAGVTGYGQYQVGDVGPAGGWVFFVDDNDEFDDWDYLEVWPHTFSFFQMLACDYSPFLSSADLGSGASNTIAFATDDDMFSVFDFASLFDGGGREDWFVPSKSELEILNASIVSGLVNSGQGYEAVASSTVFNNCNWYTYDTGGGWSIQQDLFSWLRVLPVRSFQGSEEGTQCGAGTTWDESSQTCIIANVSDTDFDGCVGINDFLVHLSNFGSGCGPEPAWACGDPLEYQGYDYETVQIGEQCWFAENLRAENYRNGDAIQSGLSDGDEWAGTTEGAVDVDEGDYLSTYGRLYNGYTAADERRLCPSAWSVPTDEDWMELEMALGMSESEANSTGWRGTDEGIQMKTTYGWLDDENGTNVSGFSGLPGGAKATIGHFYDAGYSGNWWSSSNSDDANAWYRDLELTSPAQVYRASTNRNHGFSIRCIKD